MSEGRDRSDRDADAVPDGRRETVAERSDRNWADLLQELRVLQAGTQILTAFLLAVAFQPRFTELDDYQRTLYLCLTSVSILTTVGSLLPVSLHRVLFRHRAKAETVAVGDLMLRGVLVGVSLTMVGAAMLIFDVVVGREAGLIAGAAMLVIAVLLGLVMPLAIRRRLRRADTLASEIGG